MAARVWFAALPGGDTDLADPDLVPAVARLCDAVAGDGRRAAADARWAVKFHLGAPRRPAVLDPRVVSAVTDRLGGRDRTLFVTRSITTAGLDTADALREQAAQRGFGGTPTPFAVADDPAAGEPLALAAAPGSEVRDYALAAGLAATDHVCVLVPVRPHPHVGLRGALTGVGVGLADRAAKIALHRDIRPRVDTPLCAGCGVCMTVCLFDAIRIAAGRAYIDHELCTGCGECMSVCFMAGIEADEAQGIPVFQTKIADASGLALDRLAGGRRDRMLFFNFLVGLDRVAGGTRRRDTGRPGSPGILASRDPVALDQATWDLLAERSGGSLAAWSGFKQLPEGLLARAAKIGLGEREYELVTV